MKEYIVVTVQDSKVIFDEFDNYDDARRYDEDVRLNDDTTVKCSICKRDDILGLCD